ncbi:MAG: hypothetical protein CMH54_09375 [Myxococcales bacterium]|nr:hypothetical protein [Myxococcales bacterium]|tara:strand:+ start:2184 stop:3176 length:993 start_codon:yes stop_codon:yes gene_type:complete
MIEKKFFWGFLGFLLLWTPSVYAATPTVMPIQGYLTDTNDNAIDGDVNISFALYNSYSSNSELWTEIQSITLKDGFFTAYLGQVNPVQANLFRDNHTMWLGITIENDPEMNRIQLGTQPFAAYAESCGQIPDHSHSAQQLTGVVYSSQSCAVGQVVTGFDPNGFAICETIAGAGGSYSGADFAISNQSCPPNQMMTGINAGGLIVCSPAPSGGTAGSGIQGSGTAKRIPKFDDSDTLTNSMIIEYNNKIGINESYPDKTVEIKGDLKITEDFYWGGNSFSTSSCIVMGGTSCSSACSKHKMSCYKALRIDGEDNNNSCSQSGFKMCCCRN